MVLPPCHYGFQVYTRELSHKERCDLFGHNDSLDRDYSYSKWLDDNGYPKRAISLMWNQRSVDTFLGLPFNIASYGLLLEIIAKEVNMIPDEIIGNLGDVHLYKNHIEQAQEQIGRTSFVLPQLKTDAKMDGICCNVPDDFVLEGYKSHPAIKAPLSN
jgi:thymidylate synthase